METDTFRDKTVQPQSIGWTWLKPGKVPVKLVKLFIVLDQTNWAWAPFSWMPDVGSHRVSTFNPGPEHHHPRSHPAASGLPAEEDRNQPQQTQQTQKEKVAKGCRQRVPSASIWCRSNLENENPTANVVWLCVSCKIVDEWLRISEYLIYSCSCGDCILSGPQGLALSVRPLRHHHHPRKWYLSRNVPEHTASRARNPRKSAGSSRTKSHIFAKASHCHTGLRNWSEFAMQLGASCTHPAWHPISFLIKWDPISSRKTPSRSSLLLATSQSQKPKCFKRNNRSQEPTWGFPKMEEPI